MHFLTRFSLSAALSLAAFSANAFCFDEAAREYGVDRKLLLAIAKVESNNNPRAIGPDGKDIGLMQIRTTHLRTLRKKGIEVTREDLFEPCFNVRMGAWVLADNIHRMGPVWNAVGAYNARTQSKRNIYIRKVWAAYNELVERPRSRRIHAGAALAMAKKQ